MALTMKQKLFNTLRRRIANMRRNNSTFDVMEKAVWNTLQTHASYKPTAKGYVSPADVNDLWDQLGRYFYGDPELDTRASRNRSARRPGRQKRMPRDLRNELDVQKMERRARFFEQGHTFEGGPIHDPLYEDWLIKHGIDPLDYLNRFDPEDGWEAPPWAAKYGVVWPDPDDIDDWDDDEDDGIEACPPAASVVEPFLVAIGEPRELVTA